MGAGGVKMGETGFAAVFITVPNREEGVRIAETLVAEKLAACVNQIDGICSVFRWEGKVQRETEALLMAKTASKRVDGLIARVKQLHTYSTPEVIALVIAGGNSDYLNWIAESTA